MLGFEPISGGPLSSLSPPAAAAGGVFMGGLGTLGCGTGCGCAPDACCLGVCSPCAIPEKDLTISWVNPLAGNGSDMLVYGGAGTWTTGCSGGAGGGNQLIFSLSCTGGQTDFRATYFVTGSCPTGQSNYCGSLRASGFKLNLGTSTCSPYSVQYTLSNTSCPAISASGFTSFTISDPNPLYGAVMCRRFCLDWCGAVSGATVTVYTSMGGALLASGTTNATGCVNLSWNGSPGSYYVTTSQAGYPDTGETFTLGCGGTTNIPLPSGYGCCFGYTGMLPLTLYLTIAGQMFALTAGFSGGYITNWQSGPVSLGTAGVASLTTCHPSTNTCVWDGSSTSTDDTGASFYLFCPNSVMGLEVGVSVVQSAFNGKVGMYPLSCTASGPNCVTGEGSPSTSSSAPCDGGSIPVSGTWGPSTSLSFTMPDYLSSAGFGDAGCGSPGPCAGDMGTITS
jgi:hypothetical protein